MIDTNIYQAQANELSQKLWAIANELRGQMDASEFKNYILGVIFYRYLSERTEMYMAEILENDDITYEEAFVNDDYRPVVEEWSLSKLGYVIKPENLFRNLIRKITKFENDADKFSVEDFEKAIHAAVNNDGKSGAIASVTGNILGAYLGARAIPEKYLEKLELRHIIQIIAEDLHEDCPNTNYFDNFNWIWEEKYGEACYII